MAPDHAVAEGWGLTLQLVTRRAVADTGPHVVLALTGALISPTAALAREHLHHLLVTEGNDVIVDLRALHLLDAVGVGVLVTAVLLTPVTGCLHVAAGVSSTANRAWHRTGAARLLRPDHTPALANLACSGYPPMPDAV